MFVEECKVTINISLSSLVPNWFKEISAHLKTQELCNEAVRIKSYLLEFVSSCFKTQKMCDEAVRKGSYLLELVLGSSKAQEMCIEEVKEDPWYLKSVHVDLTT